MNNKSGLLNNIKWFNLFELLEQLGRQFSLKRLNHKIEIGVTLIRELESDCLIIDDKSGFIKFLDIEKITLLGNKSLISFLEDKNYPFDTDQDIITIYGYK
ncbi:MULTISPECIES: hypothetical protein [unclassified Sphingobacterium]|uniref:hypothetical protein n=1 Tax=unclassified Sphingobacterium TaxID=2609468 RepID=UPI0010495D09|nr:MULTISPECIES: hypothetical protein [unclassified Sphingobacterium]MCS3552724.1 hypothetical protein [Sphingobacterium sp. JUb21]TCR10518.1 hypothetical protein EDF66_101332 [Sphingobacterium sp. JUb20]